MYIYNSIQHITNTLNLGKDLLEVLFEKRKSVPLRYEYALDIIDENKLEILIEREVIRRNGPYIEMDEHYLSFYGLLLEANEDISTAVIDESIGLVCQLTDYYEKEDNEARRFGYLRSIKTNLRKIGKILVRNVISLQRVVDNTFKNEPSYKVKIAKLENLDKKREDIHELIRELERLLDYDQGNPLTQIADEELHLLAKDLRNELSSAGHSLIHTQQDIISYLNQIRSHVAFTGKLRRVKYLREQFELQEKTNIREVVAAERSVCLEGVQPIQFKLSVPYLQTDEVLDAALKLSGNNPSARLVKKQELGKITSGLLEPDDTGMTVVDTRKLVDGFLCSQLDLFNYIQGYLFNRTLDYNERVTLYCKVLSLYDDELEITDQFAKKGKLEYAVVRHK